MDRLYSRLLNDQIDKWADGLMERQNIGGNIDMNGQMHRQVDRWIDG